MRNGYGDIMWNGYEDKMWNTCRNEILFKILSLSFASTHTRHTNLYKCCNVFKMGFSWQVLTPPAPPPQIIQTLLGSLEHDLFNGGNGAYCRQNIIHRQKYGTLSPKFALISLIYFGKNLDISKSLWNFVFVYMTAVPWSRE